MAATWIFAGMFGLALPRTLQRNATDLRDLVGGGQIAVKGGLSADDKLLRSKYFSDSRRDVALCDCLVTCIEVLGKSNDSCLDVDASVSANQEALTSGCDNWEVGSSSGLAVSLPTAVAETNS